MARIAAATRKKLLLVDDDPSVVASLRLVFKPDYEIYSAPSAVEGVGLFMDVHPSVVVLDLRLEGSQGLDALREIRKIDPTAKVVVLTGYASMATVEESLRLGAVDYLHKPFDAISLKQRVDQLARAVQLPQTSPDLMQPMAMAAQRIAELELQVLSSSMFLHDVANPVTTALTAATMLQKQVSDGLLASNSDTEEASELLVDSLQYLVGMFDQTRSMEHAKRLDTSEVEIEQIINLAVSLVCAKAQQRNVTTTVHLQKRGTKVWANRFALARVLSNLLRNAIEAVAPNEGRVLLLVDARDNYAEFVVQDNGPGLDTKIAPHIFKQRFTTKKEGMGLGLYICHHLVTTMGGTIEAKNCETKGCRFIVRIPCLS
jgi:signal transduction histidine kinase